VVTPEAKRNAVRYLHESFGQSLRKLCVLLGLSRASWHYKPKADVNEPIRERLRELADERKRWGGIAACITCCGERASRSITSELNGCIEKKT